MHADLLEAEGARAWRWLADAALPLWWESGADREDGGFHDQLDQCARPMAVPKRVRVQARQIFVYAEAARLGWHGPSDDAVRHGIDFMLSAYRRDDGLFRAAVRRDGTPAADDPDLYDQAFVLLALAAAFGRLSRPRALLREAEALLDRLETLLAHPEAGFENATPPALPLCSNPHMHLLEAMLAWVDVDGGSHFERRARAIVALACDRLIDPSTGAIGEYYDADWRHARDHRGYLREPGHQFEWAFLLSEADRLLGGDHENAIARMHRFGERYGIRGGRVLSSTDADGTVIDGTSRLWGQTERLRATMVVASDYSAAAESIATIRRFLDVPVPGLWRDRCDALGHMIDAPAPASSFYHLMTGLMPLIRPEKAWQRSVA